jgi:hemerythrin-like domain-containing protein
MPTVLENLREEHRNMALLLDALEHQIDVFAQGDAPDYDVICGISVYFLDYPDKCHHPKENAIYTQVIQCHSNERYLFKDLLIDHKFIHDSAVRFNDTVRALLNDTDIARSTVVDAAQGFIAVERRHMKQEEEYFFPLVERVLTPAEWSRVEGELAGWPDPIFGGRVEEKFKTVHARLLAWEEEYRADHKPLAGGARGAAES